MIAESEQQRERMKGAIAKEFDGIWEAVVGSKNAEVAEQLVVEWARKIGREVLAAGLQAAIEEIEEEAVRCCGKAMEKHSREPREVLTMLGLVRVRRRYLRCEQCRVHRRPADQWLRWRGGFSFAVEEMVAWECAALPYREALASLRKLAGIELSVDAEEQIAGRWGEAELATNPNGERVEKELVVQIDGTKAHLEDGWREIKVGACFSWDCESPEAKPEAVTYVANWQPAHEFADTLWEEAVCRGAPGARAQAVIGDDAPWIWQMAELLFPRATQILDWYHLTEHLWVAAKVVHGEGKPETTALVEQWKTQVWEGRSEGVEEHLRELVAAGKDDSDNTLRRCADYLRTHQARLRYHLFREAGWPVGSGVVEGACKHVVGLRFKRQSTRWTKAGARAVLHLRLDRLNSRWDARTQHVRQQLPHAA